jgi:hypothetical protein
VDGRLLFLDPGNSPRGTVPGAEKPCASASVSPPQNSILRASIPHEHRRQYAPTACFLHVSTAVCAPCSEQLHGYAQSHHEIPPSQIVLPSVPPLSTINHEKPAQRITRRTSKCYSISIIPVRITATASPAASFLPPNRKRLATTAHPPRSWRARDVSDVAVIRPQLGKARKSRWCILLALHSQACISRNTADRRGKGVLSDENGTDGAQTPRLLEGIVWVYVLCCRSDSFAACRDRTIRERAGYGARIADRCAGGGNSAIHSSFGNRQCRHMARNAAHSQDRPTSPD